MNTQDYLNELKMHLRKLPDEDREDAIAYYFEYLAEAGPDGAEAAMERLGPPERLAAGIRADQAMLEFSGAGADSGEAQGGAGAQGGGKASVRRGVKAVWLAGLAAVPRTALAVFVSAIVLVVFFAVMIALFAASVGLLGGGAVFVVGSFWLFLLDPATAAFYLGGGLAACALGFLMFVFSVWVGKWLLRGLAAVFNGIRRNRERRQAARAAKMEKMAKRAERKGS